MKIRTQLVLAFLLLAILPLTAIVLYSYHSSTRAVRAAVEREAIRLAGDMEGRMGSAKKQVSETLARLSAVDLPDEPEGTPSGTETTVIAQRIEAAAAAPFITAFEFAPVAKEASADDGGMAEPPDPETPAYVFEVPPVTPQVAPVPPVPSSFASPAPPVEPPLATPAAEPAVASAPAEPAAAPAPVASGIDGAASPDSSATPELRVEIAKAIEQAQSALKEIEKTDALRHRIAVHKALTEEQRRLIRDRARETHLILGHDYSVPVRRAGEVVARLKPQIDSRTMLLGILQSTRTDPEEIPFAIDREKNLYTSTPADRAKIAHLPLTTVQGPRTILENWMIATTKDPESGMIYGIAHPLREPLEEVRATAARNFGFGLGLIFIALLGIVPLANHMTRDVQSVTQGAERIAGGNLETEVPVRSQNEFGQLANAFNRMARDLKSQQERLLEEERLRKEQELQQRLLEADIARKSIELEEARNFQLALLPRDVPQVPDLEIAVFMRTATEVGGDYYDFHVADGSLTIAVGDAIGHGARAGTMVAVVKSLFSAYAGRLGPAEFLDEASATIRRMDVGRMTMALTLARVTSRGVTIAAAGMPPALVARNDGSVEEIAIEAMPLGMFDSRYSAREVPLAPGEVLLLMSDGFPELVNREGDQLGYAAVEELFAAAAGSSPTALVDDLTQTLDRWTGGHPPNDDVTFVAVRRRDERMETSA